MQFTTPVTIAPSPWQIEPCERMLFVGSCFADNIGRRFKEEKFRAIVNPFGVMYNPVSVLHTVRRLSDAGQARLSARTNPAPLSSRSAQIMSIVSSPRVRLWTTAKSGHKNFSTKNC